jgi:signal transduction histidine kinase
LAKVRDVGLTVTPFGTLNVIFTEEVQRLEHDVEIELDEERMIQVLTNILGNAAKFTKEGKIKIEISLASDKRLIEIRISDTGGGIREEIIPQLFERFVTKDVGGSAQQGTGLGLYISKAIVNAHNGTFQHLIIPKAELLLLSLCQ